MSTLRFSGFRNFDAFVSRRVMSDYLHKVGDEAVKEFKAGAASKKSGRVYKARGKVHRASAAGEYPAKDSGAHASTIKSVVRGSSHVDVGSGMFYARYLRDGTTKMAPRKMSQDALRNALRRGITIGHFASFRR